MKIGILKIQLYIVAFLSTGLAFGQDLKKEKLTAVERSGGVKYRFVNKTPYRHDAFEMILYKSGEYLFHYYFMGGDAFNVGKWTLAGNELTLQDHIDKNNVPISISYIDERDTGNFKIKVVENAKGELISDGHVYINDSIWCLPAYRSCIGPYGKIERVKVKFENGYSSQWINVDRANYGQILLVLQSEFKMQNYDSLYHSKYKLEKSFLKPIN